MNLAEAVGGVRGILESTVPGLAFLVAVTAGAPLAWAVAVAVGLCLVLVAARLASASPVRPALVGALMVAACALAALRSGDAAEFYVPGLILNGIYVVVLIVSTVPLPAHRSFTGGSTPALGLVLTAMTGGSMAWRSDRATRRLAARLTWMWAGLFALRLAVELPLYLAGAVTALGVARLALGLPPFVLLAWITMAALRRLPVPAPGAAPAPSRSPAP